MKRVLSIQDISCIGKCSLTVALPIISAMGLETAIIPTAILSTHTQFQGFTFRDLTDDLESIKEHWIREKFQFSSIYTGYLGSERQISIVRDYFKTFKRDDTKIIVDPAMAENGKLYTGFQDHFALAMAELCQDADIILPNISEATLLLGEDYPGEDAAISEIKKLLLKLTELGSKIVVITGVSLPNNKFGFMGFDTQTKEFFDYGIEKVPYKSQGTGDVFASTFTGAFTNGFSAYDSLRIAADYTGACIRNSYNDPERVFYAVNFEKELPYLLQLMQKYQQAEFDSL